MQIPDKTIEWLLHGDPAIRWQTNRDLLEEQPQTFELERAKTATEGWGAQFLSHQNSNGSWRKGRWTDSPWIILQLMDIGIPESTPSLQNSFDHLANNLIPKHEEVPDSILKTRMDLCHLGFWLRIGTYFSPQDPRLIQIIRVILSLQMSDGGWNCQVRNKPKTSHSSFHTTFNILEGLRPAVKAGLMDPNTFQESESRALEFMLDHHLYRSDKTGEIIQDRFTHLTYPSAWHYRIIRGLDYIRETPYIKDPRLNDPIELLQSRQSKDGTWITEKRIPGDNYFDMEPWGKPSRWVTLKALRILKAAQS